MLMKKYLLFIVEGINDKIEIQAMLRAFCGENFKDKYLDIFLPYNGDITIDETEKTIIGKLNKLVLTWRKGESQSHPFHPVSPSDVAKIIHVIDTDGTFIPKNSILSGDVGDIEYNDDSILCGNRDFIIARNSRKAKAIQKLLNVSKVDNIPYEVFFMSCNMDHVLFGTHNPAPTSKGSNARFFAMRCKYPKDLEGTVLAEGIRCEGTLPETWAYIQNDKNSLHRHTNLHLLLQDLSV